MSDPSISIKTLSDLKSIIDLSSLVPGEILDISSSWVDIKISSDHRSIVAIVPTHAIICDIHPDTLDVICYYQSVGYHTISIRDTLYVCIHHIKYHDYGCYTDRVKIPYAIHAKLYPHLSMIYQQYPDHDHHQSDISCDISTMSSIPDEIQIYPDIHRIYHMHVGLEHIDFTPIYARLSNNLSHRYTRRVIDQSIQIGIDIHRSDRYHQFSAFPSHGVQSDTICDRNLKNIGSVYPLDVDMDKILKYRYDYLTDDIYLARVSVDHHMLLSEYVDICRKIMRDKVLLHVMLYYLEIFYRSGWYASGRPPIMREIFKIDDTHSLYEVKFRTLRGVYRLPRRVAQIHQYMRDVYHVETIRQFCITLRQVSDIVLDKWYYVQNKNRLSQMKHRVPRKKQMKYWYHKCLKDSGFNIFNHHDYIKLFLHQMKKLGFLKHLNITRSIYRFCLDIDDMTLISIRRYWMMMHHHTRQGYESGHDVFWYYLSLITRASWTAYMIYLTHPLGSREYLVCNMLSPHFRTFNHILKKGVGTHRRCISVSGYMHFLDMIGLPLLGLVDHIPSTAMYDDAYHRGSISK